MALVGIRVLVLKIKHEKELCLKLYEIKYLSLGISDSNR